MPFHSYHIVYAKYYRSLYIHHQNFELKSCNKKTMGAFLETADGITSIHRMGLNMDHSPYPKREFP